MSDPGESPETEAEAETPTVDSKVGRVIDAYGLDGLGAWLETQWTGDGVERRSLRDLADAFNRRVLRAAMRDAGMDSLESDVESAYRLLTDDDASSGSRVELRNRLDWNGVDVEAVESDFVSHQAIHTYLRKVREAEREEPDGDPREKELDRIEQLQGRTRAVTADSLERLAKRGELTLDGFDVLVDVRVVCDRCESQYQVADLFDQGGCDCH